jgi:predicted nucleic acid-binding protein
MADRTLDAKRAPSILKRFARDRAYWTAIEVSGEVLAAAEALSRAHPLRALDAIHVASAALFRDRGPAGSFTFVSADAQQTRVAEVIGLETRYVGA